MYEETVRWSLGGNLQQTPPAPDRSQVAPWKHDCVVQSDFWLHGPFARLKHTLETQAWVPPQGFAVAR